MKAILSDVAAVYHSRGSRNPLLHRVGGHRPPLHRILIALLLASVPALTLAQTNPGDDVGPMASATLHIDKATLNTKIAATPAQEERGLMFVTHLPDNDGMLFVLPLGRAEFWMKNTLIPLSVAYIGKDGTILEIHDMQPGDPSVPDSALPRTRSDSDQIQYALETNLHWFALNGIKAGDKISPALETLARPARSPF
jgi:uncharacterized membrane protein (UPF0127 family)